MPFKFTNGKTGKAVILRPVPVASFKKAFKVAMAKTKKA